MRTSRAIGTTGVLALSLLSIAGFSSAASAADGSPTTSAVAPSGPLTPNDATYADNEGLDAAGVSARLDTLNTKYTEVGQLLSPDDLEFVRIYGYSSNSSQGQATAGATDAVTSAAADGGTASNHFDLFGSGGAETGSVSGDQSTTIGDGIDNSYSTSYLAFGSGGVTSVTTCTHVKAYGAVGSGGVGLVYYDDPCATTDSNAASFSRGISFTAFVVYMTIQPDATFVYGGGSFNVAG